MSAKQGSASAVNWKRAIAGAVAVVVVGLLIGVLRPDKDAVRYCSGEDVSETQQRSVDDFNDSESSGKTTATLDDSFSADADGQRARYREALRSGDCDVVYLDVAYMAEFAADDLLTDMTTYLRENSREQKFDGQMLQTVEHDGRLWGVPKQLDGGVLFLRGDKVLTPPRTWPEVFEQAVPASPGELPGLRLPLEGYEGLTVIVLELAYAAGAKPIVSDDGKVARVDQPEVLAVLKALRDAIDERAVPHAGVDQLERGTINVFRAGRARFLRNWVYATARFGKEAKDSEPLAKIADTVTVRSLPPWRQGGRSKSVLGGHNLVIPRSAKNPEGASRLIEFLTTPEQMTRDAQQGSLAPALNGWRRLEVVENSDALSALARTKLIPRPVIPQYAEVSAAIYTEVAQLLDWKDSSPTTDETLEQALGEIQVEVQGKLR